MREQLRVIVHYYFRSWRFALLDFVFGLVALVVNPYRVCRKFLERRGEANVFAYGETPLTEFEKLMKAAQLTAEDTYVELGSGRGKTCFWAALFVGCKVRGVEWIPRFVRIARRVARVLRIQAEFSQGSILETSLMDAGVVYFYGIDRDVEPLIPLFEQMAPGARLVTISEPVPSGKFVVQRVVQMMFPWGTTEAFIHLRHYAICDALSSSNFSFSDLDMRNLP